MTKVTVEGYGTFVVPNEQVQELLNWLARNQSARVIETNTARIQYPGKDLLNG